MGRGCRQGLAAAGTGLRSHQPTQQPPKATVIAELVDQVNQIPEDRIDAAPAPAAELLAIEAVSALTRALDVDDEQLGGSSERVELVFYMHEELLACRRTGRKLGHELLLQCRDRALDRLLRSANAGPIAIAEAERRATAMMQMDTSSEEFRRELDRLAAGLHFRGERAQGYRHQVELLASALVNIHLASVDHPPDVDVRQARARAAHRLTEYLRGAHQLADWDEIESRVIDAIYEREQAQPSLFSISDTATRELGTLNARHIGLFVDDRDGAAEAVDRAVMLLSGEALAQLPKLDSSFVDDTKVFAQALRFEIKEALIRGQRAGPQTIDAALAHLLAEDVLGAVGEATIRWLDERLPATEEHAFRLASRAVQNSGYTRASDRVPAGIRTISEMLADRIISEDVEPERRALRVAVVRDRLLEAMLDDTPRDWEQLRRELSSAFAS